ncbi:aminotransferase class V-fold PLP-dependent enzyme [Rhizohabitans arisaemae]|uniref:aminotransferase class V-fold PLP-dependent enzyme n=1 Tax=Rhizohabitans arisaemae TaxID=2720610 RepID=UPI0024B12BD3|nr:aminotransferase class V-fold PLP-dependent enzyme [Rhizohabitans arisaemae]
MQATLDELRATEYAYLDNEGHVYLDYAGAGIPADIQIREHADLLRGRCFGNPHSENPTSKAATDQVASVRRAVLSFFNADPDEYAVVFTAGATAACRLVGEAYPFRRLILTVDNHNSVNGLGVFARTGKARIDRVPVDRHELRTSPEDVARALRRGRRGLFAYPAQSNFSGVRHPLDWVDLAHEYGHDVLLDAAAYVPTSPLDLSVVKPDYMPVSWYKVFGYPTGTGCLIARWDALRKLRRPWFSGGTVWGVSVAGGWHRLTSDETAFEDGTIDFLSIPAIGRGLDWIQGIGMREINLRVTRLTGYLLTRLKELRHGDGSPMVRFYGPAHADRRGGTVTVNFLDRRGGIVDERAVARDAAAQGISLRTGCFCNPGASEAAFGLTRGALRAAMRQDVHDVETYLDRIRMPSGGAVRVSLGVASNVSDVEEFIRFAEETYRDTVPATDGLARRLRC